MDTQISLKNSEQREAFFIALYKSAFPKIAAYIRKRGGSLEDANDIFQDSVIAYYEKTVAGLVCHNEQAYLMGIAKHLWLNKLKQPSNQPLTELLNNQLSATEPEQHLTEKLLSHLETAGQKCLQLLKAFYYDQIAVSEIAERFGYSGVRSATVQKYKCLEKVRSTVKQKALHYEDFVA